MLESSRYTLAALIPRKPPIEQVAVTIQDTIEIRVRYNETDGQGRVHHAQYLNFFERGRVELLRSLGHSYRELEQEQGLMLVVAEMNVRYLGAAVFDDVLEMTTRVVRSRGVRIQHAYEIVRRIEADLPRTPIVQATSVIACVDRQGKVRPLPEYLRIDRQ
jgi:acyl-CoA thioester hydrolase